MLVPGALGAGRRCWCCELANYERGGDRLLVLALGAGAGAGCRAPVLVL